MSVLGLALAVTIGAGGGAVLMPGAALAANECPNLAGVPNETITCTNPDPASGVVNGGIEYLPGSASSLFTLNVGDGTTGGSVSVTAPTVSYFFQPIGQYGVAVVGSIGSGFSPPIPLSGANSSVVVNINLSSQVQGTGGGVLVWTQGNQHNATLNNYGKVVTPGIGGLTPGIGLIAVSNDANASIRNYGTGTVDALNNAMSGYSLSGTSVVTLQNDGVLRSQQLDGMSSIDPVAGILPTWGGAEATNNGTINVARHGINLAAIDDATVTLGATSVINAGTGPSGTGVIALSLEGNTIVTGNAKSQTNSGVGPGIVGISLEGTSTVDAGIVDSGSGAAELFGFTVPSIPGLPTLSGGVLSLAYGDATANAHGNITTDGTFGVLALSVNGNATATSDAGITVDPPIGMAAITGGSNLSTVTNNGTQISTIAGLLGVNIGDGAVSITNSTTGVVNATSGAGVVAIKIGEGDLANSVDGTNSVVVRNDNTGGGPGGSISAPNGPGVFVLALDPTLTTPNNVLVSNTNRASINGGGGLLTPTIGVLADGNVRIDNDVRSRITNASGASGIGVIVLAGGDAALNNDHRSRMTGNVDIAALGGNATVTNNNRSTWTFSGISAIGASGDAALVNDNRSQINGTDALLAVVGGHDASISNARGADLNLSGVSASLIIAGNDASIHNYRGGSFNMDGVSANIMVATRNASITNEQRGSFNVDGLTGGNFMFAGGNASITNDTRGRFTMSSLLNANVMVATVDTTISNDNRGSFSLDGLASGNFMVAGGNASISNDHRGSTTFANLVGANVMIANGNASITNRRGGDFTMLGLVNGNVMVADTGSASITNEYGGDFTMAGLANGNVMVAGKDASITNDHRGGFSMVGLANGNVMVANTGNASITNDHRSDFTLGGINGNVMVAANGNASISNDNRSDFNLLGLTGSFMVAGNDATISNANRATMNIVGASGDFMIAANDIRIDNNSDGVINFRGVNALGFVEGGTSTFNNNSVVRVAGLGNLPGITSFFGLDQFNNAGELTMMTNVIGDVTYTSGDYVGIGGLLSQDVYLDGAGGSSSDLLYINGQGSGTTLIAVNDLHGGPGTYDPVGTKLVFAYTAASGPAGTEFALRDGPMDYGLYTYDLKYYYTADDPAWFLANGPNERAFELATIPSQIQNMVATLDSTWHDRTADLRDSAGTSDGGGGVWLKAVGSYTGRDYNQSFTDANGTYTYNGHSDQRIGGMVGGADVVVSTDEGLNVLLGVTGSYMASATEYQSGSRTQIAGTGVGAYATLLKDGFFIDAIGRVQFLGINHTTAAPWSETVSPDAKAYSVVLDAGYRGELGAVTVEPMATLAYNRVVIDSFNLLGNSVSFAGQDSLRGRLGMRVSTTATGEGTAFKPFLEANLWSQFMGNNSATISGGAVDLTLHDNTGGLSGEVKGGFDVVADTWSGFVSAQVNKSERSISAGAQAGVRVDF